MAIRIKPIETLKAKYKAKATAASGDYKDGVANPRRDQKAATLAAKDTYTAAMNESLAEGRFEKGVESTPAGKWAANATNVGAGRYGPGITNAVDAWGSGVAPILQALAAVPDMPRGVKGSEQNFQRQRAYADAAAAAAKK
jgi:hypothetical protein